MNCFPPRLTQLPLPSLPRRSSEQGLTLMEPLVALLIIGVTMAVFTPPVMMAMATRVKNYRTEQAINVAQAEIDRIQRLVERETDATKLRNLLPKPITANTPQAVGAPNSTTCNPPTALSLCPVGPSSPNLYWQRFRVQTSNSDGSTNETSLAPPVAMLVGVRIYTKESVANIGSLLTNVSGSGGVGTGYSQLRTPIVTLYAPVSRSDFWNTTESSLRRQCVLLNAAQGTSATCPVN